MTSWNDVSSSQIATANGKATRRHVFLHFSVGIALVRTYLSEVLGELYLKNFKMPQLKKISVLPSSLLPKIESVYSSYPITQQDASSYVPIYYDIKSSTLLTSEAESDGADSLPPKPRKRQRLDHLSQEEKIMRRKLKNRVAAQTARDRKKAKMMELEEQVMELETEKRMLLIANTNLEQENKTLRKENTELKLRLSGKSLNEVKVEKESSPCSVKASAESRLSDSSRSLEHASFINVPLQKGQDLRILAAWMMHLIYLPVIARLMLFLIYLNNVAKVCCSMKTSAVLFKNLDKAERVKYLPLKWWGPHQKAWNPTKN